MSLFGDEVDSVSPDHLVDWLLKMVLVNELVKAHEKAGYQLLWDHVEDDHTRYFTSAIALSAAHLLLPLILHR